LFDFGHWDNLYNQAVKKIQVTTDTQGVAKLQATDPPKPAAVYNGMFVKSSTALKTTPANEKELFSHCGSRELRRFRQEGKMNRLKKFETEGLTEYDEYFKHEEEVKILETEPKESEIEKIDHKNFKNASEVKETKKNKKRKREKEGAEVSKRGKKRRREEMSKTTEDKEQEREKELKKQQKTE